MSMTDDPHTWTGAVVRNRQGEELGRVEGMYFHDATGRATWAAVGDGEGVALAPMEDAEFDGHELSLPYSVQQLAAAPRPPAGAHLDPTVENELYRHYGLASNASDAQGTTTAPAASDQRDTRTDHAPGEMVLSREKLRTGVEVRPSTRFRLVTYVVTEDVTFTVPVSRQEVRLEEVPLDGSEEAVADRLVEGLSEAVHEVVLHREEVRFVKSVVPAERVRLIREVVRTWETVSAELRSEKVDLDHGETSAGSGADALEHDGRQAAPRR